jgi:hypothetical protein
MLLICPTCQVSAQSVGAGDRRLLCMGLFSIFCGGSQRPGVSVLARLSRYAKWRATADEDGPYRFALAL